MKIIDIINDEKLSLSFEVFPPKSSDKFDKLKPAIDRVAELKPDFMSVTYGAGGGTSQFTADIAADIEKKGVPCLAHLTCVSSTKEFIENMIDIYKEKGLENILALRGDIPEDLDPSAMEYRHASELIEMIRTKGDFCIGGACYPETHPESHDSTEDIENLKKKVDAGCEFMTTQLFFDNDAFYRFMWRIRDMGIDIPVVAGIMPITAPAQIERVVKMSDASMPQPFVHIVDKFMDDPASLRQAGIAYATNQIIDLYANGVKAVHLYTMNKPEIAGEIQKNVSDIIRCK